MMSSVPCRKKLFCVGTLFLVAQAIIYTFLAFFNGRFKSHSPVGRKLSSPSLHLNISVSVNFLEEGHEVAHIFKEQGCSPFIVSPRILAHIWNVQQNIPDCVGSGEFCMLDGDDVFLAVDSSCLPERRGPFELFAKRLHEKNFLMSATQSWKITRLPPEPAIFLTSLIIKRKYAFLVIVLHSREDSYWWHGSIFEDRNSLKKLAKFGLLPANLVFMHNEGAITKFDHVDIKLQHHHFLIPKDIPAFLRAISSSASNFVECDYKRADLYFKTHGQDRSFEAVRFKHQAWKVLSRAKRVLDDLEVPFWLSSGTCLGYLRQCDFIPYSQDVDLGIFASDFNDGIIPEFLSHGFKLHHTFGRPNDSYQIAFEYNKLKLDLFFFYLDKEKGIIWNGGTEARSGQKFKYTFPVFSLCWTDFLDLLVRVPCNTTRYIEANYGPHWFTPITEWNWRKSPPNVEKNGMWEVKEWQEVINIIPSS